MDTGEIAPHRWYILGSLRSLLAAKGYLPKNAGLPVVVPVGLPRRLSSGVDILALPDLLARMMEA
jgi:hypothetical protein